MPDINLKVHSKLCHVIHVSTVLDSISQNTMQHTNMADYNTQALSHSHSLNYWLHTLNHITVMPNTLHSFIPAVREPVIESDCCSGFDLDLVSQMVLFKIIHLFCLLKS